MNDDEIKNLDDEDIIKSMINDGIKNIYDEDAIKAAAEEYGVTNLPMAWDAMEWDEEHGILQTSISSTASITDLSSYASIRPTSSLYSLSDNLSYNGYNTITIQNATLLNDLIGVSTEKELEKLLSPEETNVFVNYVVSYYTKDDLHFSGSVFNPKKIKPVLKVSALSLESSYEKYLNVAIEDDFSNKEELIYNHFHIYENDPRYIHIHTKDFECGYFLNITEIENIEISNNGYGNIYFTKTTSTESIFGQGTSIPCDSTFISELLELIKEKNADLHDALMLKLISNGWCG